MWGSKTMNSRFEPRLRRPRGDEAVNKGSIHYPSNPCPSIFNVVVSRDQFEFIALTAHTEKVCCLSLSFFHTLFYCVAVVAATDRGFFFGCGGFYWRHSTHQSVDTIDDTCNVCNCFIPLSRHFVNSRS